MLTTTPTLFENQGELLILLLPGLLLLATMLAPPRIGEAIRLSMAFALQEETSF